MGHGLKQRLLGVVVLLGLLILLAPALFQRGNEHPLVIETQPALTKSPEVPAYIKVLDTAPDSVDVIAPAVPPVTEEDGFLKAWVLQMATFTGRENAEKLEKRLKKAGYSAHTEPVRRDDGAILYQVFVGPEVRQEDLKAIKPALDKRYKVSSIIVRFRP